ncbi:MAG: hypothetical protein ACYCOU_00315 [Sulfobacillus sp.]
MTQSTTIPAAAPKKPRHVNIATKHLIAQREKAIAIRDKASKEVEDLDAALLALGWPDDNLPLFQEK